MCFLTLHRVHALTSMIDKKPNSFETNSVLFCSLTPIRSPHSTNTRNSTNEQKKEHRYSRK